MILIVAVLGRVTCQILPHLTIGSPTTSALAANFTYLFTSVLVTPFPSPQLSIFIIQHSFKLRFRGICLSRNRP